jgi:predicted dinucleotide-binding enzyme
MNIAIIGMGDIGSGLAHVLSETEYSVVVVDRDGGTTSADKLKAEGIEVQSADIATAVEGADIVILSTPYDAAAEVAGQADFTGKIVVDVSNPVTVDFSALQLGHTSSAAEEIAKLMPGTTVVKAFNTIFAQHYANGLEMGGQKLQTFIASDDKAARESVKRLAEEIGLDARDAGPLFNARYLEPMGFMNIQFGYVLGQGVGIAPQWLAA